MRPDDPRQREKEPRHRPESLRGIAKKGNALRPSVHNVQRVLSLFYSDKVLLPVFLRDTIPLMNRLCSRSARRHRVSIRPPLLGAVGSHLGLGDRSVYQVNVFVHLARGKERLGNDSLGL